MENVVVVIDRARLILEIHLIDVSIADIIENQPHFVVVNEHRQGRCVATQMRHPTNRIQSVIFYLTTIVAHSRSCRSIMLAENVRQIGDAASLTAARAKIEGIPVLHDVARDFIVAIR